MTHSGKDVSTARAASADIAAFIERAKAVDVRSEVKRGRLIFALDATLSRQPTWDLAQSLQGKMFETTASLGGLDVQLVYFRGFMECRASSFIANGEGLADLMSRISVRGGETQIGKVLQHVRREAQGSAAGALIFVGDAMEENADKLSVLAGEIAVLGVKAFMFQEGADATAAAAFKEIARLTGGAYAAFDVNAPKRLSDLLAAAAAYAAGGRLALEKHVSNGGEAARLLLTQMR